MEDELELFFLVNPLIFNIKDIETENPEINISDIKLKNKNESFTLTVQDFDRGFVHLTKQMIKFGLRNISTPKR
jgi:signal transduction histidine kinase